jgi:drug/metabolite transporter superfamily protein YnfA
MHAGTRAEQSRHGLAVRSGKGPVNRATSLLILLLAAILEAGGDAFMRFGLKSPAPWSRVACFTVAALALFAYGWTVNAPPWDFGKLLGLYVVFFFMIAQLISWLVFKQAPSRTVLLGGLLILAGGIVISLGKA